MTLAIDPDKHGAIAFFVPGKPVPQGSMVSGRTKAGGTYYRHSNKKTEPWRAVVAYTASQNYSGPLLEGPLFLDMVFNMPRPKAHFNKAGLRPDAPRWCQTTPDIDKLIRAIGDSLTGICYKDDKQIAWVKSLKVYSDLPGCAITITEIKKRSNEK